MCTVYKKYIYTFPNYSKISVTFSLKLFSNTQYSVGSLYWKLGALFRPSKATQIQMWAVSPLTSNTLPPNFTLKWCKSKVSLFSTTWPINPLLWSGACTPLFEKEATAEWSNWEHESLDSVLRNVVRGTWNISATSSGLRMKWYVDSVSGGTVHITGVSGSDDWYTLKQKHGMFDEKGHGLMFLYHLERKL